MVDPTRLNSLEVKERLITSGTQELSGAGAVDVENFITELISTGAHALTLADGVEGQQKYIVMKTFVGISTITPTNLGNGTTLAFGAVGDACLLMFTNGSWYLMSNIGVAIA